ncbi:MAG: MerR family transcriptional regulator [Magnetococcales bacterium]|nr:MerR family transcriptional regulator [Magnetococcales bacterium]
MWTIGRMARRFGLSRTTLLYYDRIGLLTPSLRSSANYRLYSEQAFQRMTRIMTLRESGLSLAAIRELLDSPESELNASLQERLIQLNQEIAHCRRQQRHIIGQMKSQQAASTARTMDKERWVAMLDGAGMDDKAKENWHALFEADAPEAHQDFLESLGIDPEEINHIRRQSRGVE